MSAPRSRLLVTCNGCGRDARVSYDVPGANFCEECCPGAQGSAAKQAGPWTDRERHDIFGRRRRAAKESKVRR